MVGLDYEWTGTYFRHFKNPPHLPSEVELELFGQDLAEEIPEKLKQLVERADQLETDKRNDLAVVRRHVDDGGLDEFGEYFWTYWVMCEYAEIFMVKKWTKYWLKLASMVNSGGQWAQVQDDNSLSDEMIQTAKDFPIEQMYTLGELRTGHNRLMGLCPFHGERTPSFVIYTDNNTYYCFGCHEGGDAIDFYMKTKEASFYEAVKALQ